MVWLKWGPVHTFIRVPVPIPLLNNLFFAINFPPTLERAIDVNPNRISDWLLNARENSKTGKDQSGMTLLFRDLYQISD